MRRSTPRVEPCARPSQLPFSEGFLLAASGVNSAVSAQFPDPETTVMHAGSRIAVVALAALLALPAAALSKEHGRDHGQSRKHSSGSVRSGGDRHRGGGSGRSSTFRESRSKERQWAPRAANTRERSWSRDARPRTLARNETRASRERTWSSDARDSRQRSSRERVWSPSRSSGERAWRSEAQRTLRTPRAGSVERRYRDPSPGRIARGDARNVPREGRSSRRYADSRSSTRYRDGGSGYGGGSSRYKPSGPIVRGGSGYRGHRGPRQYYVGSFYRPSYVVRSGFSIGINIGTLPAFGYRYYDPYCELHFHSLGSYYGHCHGLGHPSAILVIDYETHAPIATCIYDSGDWVVDDCSHDGGDYAYEEYEEYYDEEY